LRLTTLLPVAPLALLAAGCSPSYYKESADEQVYAILEDTSVQVTGLRRTFGIERVVDETGHPIHTLRGKILRGEIQEVQLGLVEALDVAAENSRDFQRQKEQLYLAALSLTRSQHDFALRWGGGGSAEVSGDKDDATNLTLRDDLSASVNTVSGTRIVASFVNNFLKNILTGGAFDASSILNLSISQPLLRGAGSRIVREGLTQSERDMVYQMRDFERARGDLAIRIVTDYYGIVQQIADLDSERRNYESVKKSRELAEALFAAGRRPLEDKDRAYQNELSAEIRLVNAENRLDTTLDRFKITLGLPIEFELSLDSTELENLRRVGAQEMEIDEARAIELALLRRFDLRNTIDNVADAARRIIVAEDALSMALDFSGVLNVPSEAGSSMNLDWSRINWAAGFDLDLALDKLAERNAYRTALINLDVAFRNRDQAVDQIVSEVRASLRDIQNLFDNYRINSIALDLARRRVDATEALFEAGRTRALEVLDAKDDLLAAELNLTDSIVSYNIARLNFLHDLEGLVLEPKGLRYDPGLPIPAGADHEVSSRL